MNDLLTAFCPHCGAADYGTRFCSTCGQEILRDQGPTASAVVPIPAPAAAPVAAAGAPKAPNAFTAGSLFYVFGFIAYLLGAVVPNLLVLVFDAFSFWPESYGVFRGVILVLFFGGAGVLVAIGALTSSVSMASRRITGSILGFAFVLYPLLSFIPFVSHNFWIHTTLFLVFSGMLFVAWAVSRPFRGPGYFGLLIGLCLAVLLKVFFLLAPFGYGLAMFITSAVASGIPAVVTVLTAWAFERKLTGSTAPIYVTAEGVHPLGASPYSSAVSVQGNNQLALMALIFGLLGTGPLAIVLGHIARRQIRRTGEQGAGMALTGLIFGYFQTSVLVLFLIIGLVRVLLNIR